MSLDIAMAKNIPLSDLFNRELAWTGEHFPDLHGRLLIADTHAGDEAVFYGVENQRRAPHERERTISLLHAHPNVRGALLSSHSRTQSLYSKATGVELIIFSEKTAPALLEPDEARHITQVLRHELAHRLIPETADRLLGECIADAFTLLRHYQEHGTDAPFADKYMSPHARVYDMVFWANPQQFTFPVLDAIRSIRHTLRLDGSAQETAALARVLAARYAPSEALRQKLLAAFAPVAALEKAGDHAAAVAQLVRITRDPACDPDVFRVGDVWLKANPPARRAARPAGPA